MKKHLSFLLALIICVSLFSGVLMTGASAVSGTVGDYLEVMLFDTEDWYEQIEGYDVCSVPGMSYEVRNSDTELWICGTPTVGGNFGLDGYVYTDHNATYGYNAVLAIGKKTVNVSKTYTATVGEKVNNVVYSFQYDQLGNCKETWNGLTMESSGSMVDITGTPTAAGTHTFTATVTDGNWCNVNMTVSFTVKEAPFEVTKSPSGETRTEGESALFISSANNYSDVEWRIVTKDGENCWRGKNEIENKFPGVQVSIYQNDAGQECLYLSNIPLSMNGYYVQTKFWSKDKSETKFTSEHSCLITVKEAVLGTPKITGQPQGAELTTGQSTTLYVTASSPDGNVLKYQWYKNNTNSTAGGQTISGATSNSYTPQEIEGTVYYYCAVYNTKGDKTSAAVYSNAAAVKYSSAAQPSPTPSAAPAPSPTPEAQATPEPIQPVVTTPTPNNGPGKNGNGHEEDSEKSDHTLLFVIAGVIVVALVCGTVIYLKTSGSNTQRRRRDDYEEDDWDYNRRR